MNLCTVSWAKRRGKGFLIPTCRIRVGYWGNARTDITEEMVINKANSLKNEGQKTAVKGLLSSCGNFFDLTDGEIRLSAALYAIKNMNYNIDTDKGGLYCEIESGFSSGGKIRYPTANEVIKLQLSYGTDSEPLSDYDKARSVSKLFESGEKISDLAVILHCSEQSVRNLLAISSVPDRVKDAVKPTTAVKYARASIPTRNEIYKKIISGEKVKGKDISSKKEEEIKVIQERIFSTDDIRHLCKDGHSLEAIARIYECKACGELECTRPDISISKIPYEENT